MSNEQPATSGVHLNVEGDGVKESTVAWVGILCLVVGLVAGGWIAQAVWGYEPSTEYVTRTAELETRLEAAEDSLRDAQRAVEVADQAVVDAETATLEAVDDLEDARQAAALARQRADAAAARAVGARAAGASPEEVAEAEEEARDAAVDAVEAERAECDACGRTVTEQAVTITTLHEAVRKRDNRIEGILGENTDLRSALALAQAEVARASGRIVKRWYHPVVTVGYGWTLDDSLQRGPTLAVGVSFSPLDLIRRFR